MNRLNAMKLTLTAHEVHVWSISLALTNAEQAIKLACLSPEEVARANRFHLPVHQRRFIAAHAALREILSYYLDCSAKQISFGYTTYHKPFLSAPHTQFQFNLAHSDEMAVVALTLDHAIGIDIEKIAVSYNPGVVKRYFSPQENQAFFALSEAERNTSFYRVWARKEAMVKATGKGLFLPLNSFSVSLNDETETILLNNEPWTLVSLSIDAAYQAALATNQHIGQIVYKIMDQKTRF
ncbi:MAG TPA: 4'-phosphopantetheinyl transferase superfamily protein [Gammaproteobacteria bacterium]|jgi:4'-phosphopantetheinyl transferase|nr:4'-phosphopantetheinyl transferase superfamily protein [Gammaproteobacteria bacterium]